jgi:predicted RNA-binding Zn-ribbon protein involved in translation (DUF1610 family)
MSNCAGCKYWIIERGISYTDGTYIGTFQNPAGRGECQILTVQTAEDFGCNKFEAGTEHRIITRKIGAPHQHWVMIPCPDCEGKGDGARGHRCAGTGLVRLYDDGYVGDEQTRLHPKEKATPPTCMACGKQINLEWVSCPYCGQKTPRQAETEVVAGLGSSTL